MLSVAVGLPLAWAVSRTNVPAKRFIHLTAVVSYLTPPYLTAIAFVNLFSPKAGLVNRFVRDVLGHARAHLQRLLDGGPGPRHRAPHVSRSCTCWRPARSSRWTRPWRSRRRSSAPAAGARRRPSPLPLVAPAVLSGALIAFVNAIALFGSQAIIGLPGRVFTLPTRIYALFDYPPQYGLASAMSLIFVAITVVALYLQRRYLARRSYVTLGGKGSRPQLVDLGRRAGACSPSAWRSSWSRCWRRT